jgi:hypothetical protein
VIRTLFELKRFPELQNNVIHLKEGVKGVNGSVSDAPQAAKRPCS